MSQINSNKIKNRKFQFWEYKVSHGSLLLRSPKTAEGFETNVDIVFSGVEYISLPRHIDRPCIVIASQSDLEFVSGQLGRSVQPAELTVLTSNLSRYYVVAIQIKILETTGDIFDTL